jgi:hypothetical protein
VKHLVATALLVFGTTGAFAEPDLQFLSNPMQPNLGSIELKGLDARLIDKLKDIEPSAAHWQTAFSVRVQDAAMEASSGPLPGVLGDYEILGDRVRFTPRYPLTRGLTYRAEVDLNALFPAKQSEESDLTTPVKLTFGFSLPKAEASPSTVVNAVFPSADIVPENLLRFYVHFSSPMQQGWVRDHIHLRRADGQQVEAAFLDLRTELWDPSMRRLTLLLDPGRIKRGVGPNVEGGAPLRQGEGYTLAINAGMEDANGNRLRKGFTKTFHVMTALRVRVDPKDWSLVGPVFGTRQALELGFPMPLDRAMLGRVIRVVGVNGQPVVGTIAIDRHETRWVFTPSVPWKPGQHHVLVGTTLEDVSGNNVIAPFDMDLRAVQASEDPPVIALPFEPRAQHSVTKHGHGRHKVAGSSDGGE